MRATLVVGKCGRGAAGKIPVFGILKRKNKVFTKIIRVIPSVVIAFKSRGFLRFMVMLEPGC